MEKRLTKITGDRSIQSKLQRLAHELEADSARVWKDYGPEQEYICSALLDVSKRLSDLARRLD